ncbi:hypothetical protein DM01DRAFT_1108567 [Hesseltinella vesiculosa]|uniref:Nudix hydrolase domain-containing protein n=1 Tax=Hesseltinella vesiculosa TaxID=101127 RepID=A0A1X2GAE6_9FUNG|nr:hypothetical protein DM01DRAFT_1108567 [Hesseltinella vesiculosa]
MSLQNLRNLCDNLQTSPVVSIDSPPSYPRRAAVVAIVRWHPEQDTLSLEPADTSMALLQQWQDIPGHLEMLYIQRAKRPGDVWSGQVAFPGGKSEPQDTTDVETAAREVLEEIGLDLNDKQQFLYLGKLDDHQILTAKQQMVVVPFVFLQRTPVTPPLALQASEVANVFCKRVIVGKS